MEELALKATLPAACVAGLLLSRELKFLGETIAHPPRPFVAILGGAKVSDKLPALNHLIGRVDTILIGGAMAYTFLLAQGKSIGRSLVQRDLVVRGVGQVLQGLEGDALVGVRVGENFLEIGDRPEARDVHKPVRELNR